MSYPLVRLADVCEVRIGRTPRRDTPAYWGGLHPWVTIRELNGGQVSTTREGITDLAVRTVMPPPVTPGTLLFSFKLSIGKMAFAAVPLHTNEAIAALPIVDQTKIIPEFLFYALKSVSEKQEANHAVLGKVLNKSKVEGIRFPLPPLDEQHRIVDLLSRAESLKRLAKEAQVKARELIPALFVEMFGGSPEKKWPLRLLREVSDIRSGITKGRKATAALRAVPYMRVANVQDGHLDLSSMKEIEATDDEIKRFALAPGDLLLTEGGDLDKLGRGAIWEGKIDPCIHQNHVFAVRVDRGLATPAYLAAVTSSGYGKAYFLSVAKRTTGIASINKTQLGNLPVPLPPLDLQMKFEDRLVEISSIRNLADRATITARNITSSAMARLFEA